jgi:hypothetical protein
MTATPSGQPDRRASSALQWLYLLLAVAGAVLPWLANLEFIQAYGATGNLGLFVRLANDNPAASSLSRDLAIGATAVLIWIVSESRRLQMRGLVWVLLSCFTLAFACGAPLFLYLRERRLAELAQQSPAWPGPSAAPAHGESAEQTAERAET